MNRKLNTRQIGIVITAVITALIHLIALNIFMIQITGSIDILFTLNGLGFLVLLAAYFLPNPILQKYHAFIRWAFIAFTVITILAWVVMGDKSLPAGALGYLTKLDELILIILLFLDRE
jgi:hypothetical protein